MTDTAWLDFLRESESRAMAKFHHYRLISEKSKTAWANKFAREKGQNEDIGSVGPVTAEDSTAGSVLEEQITSAGGIRKDGTGLV